MNLSIKLPKTKLHLTSVLFYFNTWHLHFVKCSINFDKNLSYIIYSPYTNYFNQPSRLQSLITKNKNEYSIEDIQEQLSTIRTNFSSVITLGMGVTIVNMDSSWNKTNSESLISTAAAYLNLNTKDESNHIKIMQGIRISEDDELSSAEIRNAIEAINNANKIFPQTVQSVLINCYSIGEELLNETIRKFESYSIKLPYGIRMSYSLCCENLLSSFKYVTNAKFLICILKRKPNLDPNNFKNDTQSCEYLLSKANQGNPQVLCEFGGATTGLLKPVSTLTRNSIRQNFNDFINFWDYICKWSHNQISTSFVINEAFDQPGICDAYTRPDPIPACHRGIWLPLDNNYILKTTLLDSTSDEQESGTLNAAIILVPIVSIVGITLIVIGIILWKRAARIRQKLLNDKDYEEFLKGLVDDTENDESIALRLPYNKELLELPKSSFTIEMSQILGCGNFGTVFKGHYKPTNATVAFKTINHILPDNLKNFLAELKIISYIGQHPNVVCLIGAYTKEVQKGTIYIVLEYCSNGSLQRYLRKHSSSDTSHSSPAIENYQALGMVRYCNDPTTGYINLEPNHEPKTDLQPNQLLKWAYELTSAMAYLETKKVIHGDLATRNILLNSKYESKLTDFGLSRRLYEYTDYVRTSKDPLPWRWMPPESLTQMHFSTKSDVWSYGVVLWEIFTLGDIPYPGLNYTTEFSDQLESGLRLPKPELASDELFNLMQRCWKISPIERPAFCEILMLFPAAGLAHDYSNIQN